MYLVGDFSYFKYKFTWKCSLYTHCSNKIVCKTVISSLPWCIRLQCLGGGSYVHSSNKLDLFSGYMQTLCLGCLSCKTRTPAGCTLVVTVTRSIILFIPALADGELLGRLWVFLGISSISMWANPDIHSSSICQHVLDMCVTCNSNHLPTQFPQHMLQNSIVLVWPLQV